MAGNGFSIDATMSPDGRYVAFMSTATDLVAGDTNGVTDVFVRDMQTGLTMLASPGARSAGMNPKIGNIGSEAPDISANGRFVAFYSSASNLVSDASISIVGNTASLQDNSATGATRYYRIVGF